MYDARRVSAAASWPTTLWRTDSATRPAAALTDAIPSEGVEDISVAPPPALKPGNGPRDFHQIVGLRLRRRVAHRGGHGQSRIQRLRALDEPQGRIVRMPEPAMKLAEASQECRGRARDRRGLPPGGTEAPRERPCGQQVQQNQLDEKQIQAPNAAGILEDVGSHEAVMVLVEDDRIPERGRERFQKVRVAGIPESAVGEGVCRNHEQASVPG